MKTILAASTALAILFGPAAAEARTFTSRNGKTLEAEIVSATDKQVELKTPAGKTFNVPLSSLSDKDQLEIGIWREEQQKQKALAGVTLTDLFKSQGVGAVSFRSDDGLMFVEASVNDKTAVFLIDLRLEPTLLDEPAVAKLGLEMKAAAGGIQGAKGQVDLTAFKFGETDLGATQIPVVSFDNMAASLRPKLDGILGTDFLRKHRVLLDYAEMKLWLRPEK
jgi:hypothetical protein